MPARRRHREHPDGEPFVARETRSYEVTHVHGLWHLDFHEGSRPVLVADGQWQKPQLLGVLDDRSRLCCHLQWYLDETAEALIHGLSQAFQKRGLPRALLTDNGAAMLAAETPKGSSASASSITRPCLFARAKRKAGVVLGTNRRPPLPMLEGEPALRSSCSTPPTQAWAEEEYQRKEHSEIHEIAARALHARS